MEEAAFDETFQYVVVGSGAGGGPLASNLARAGKRVLLLEAGGDDGGAHYEVPCFHALSTEDPRLSWSYFVHHYSDEAREKEDPKYSSTHEGVLYPRAGTLGGCTAHNAMITVYPHDEDWDRIASETGDESWRADRMRTYFERLEHYRGAPWRYPGSRLLTELIRALPFLDRYFGNKARHGHHGWLHTRIPDVLLVLRDKKLLKVVAWAALSALDRKQRWRRLIWELYRGFDLNDVRLPNDRSEGIWVTSVAVDGARRNGTREFIQRTAAEHPDELVVRTGALATRVVLDDDNRAVGVEYVEGGQLYRADQRANGDGELPRARRVGASAEVIVSAGAFNTPQLLKLSGIGPGDELRRHGIDVKVDLKGVGENLQDRYEVGVVSEMNEDFSLLGGATWKGPTPDGSDPDPVYAEWRTKGEGPYTSNGVALAVVRRSSPKQPVPDLFVFGLPSYFRGYFPDYSKAITEHADMFTWAVLKAHTNNTAGSVKLASGDPRDVPHIDFRYFDEGTDDGGEDLEAVVDGVKFARRLMGEMSEHIKAEVVPGRQVATDDQVREFVKDNAWGHHASCTCKIGATGDEDAVLSSDFRVRGTSGLRVVDASVFPRIPGFFIVSAVYMVSEKASEAILGAPPPSDGPPLAQLTSRLKQALSR
jgi:choline dehydrogenase